MVGKERWSRRDEGMAQKACNVRIVQHTDKVDEYGEIVGMIVLFPVRYVTRLLGGLGWCEAM